MSCFVQNYYLCAMVTIETLLYETIFFSNLSKNFRKKDDKFIDFSKNEFSEKKQMVQVALIYFQMRWQQYFYLAALNRWRFYKYIAYFTVSSHKATSPNLLAIIADSTKINRPVHSIRNTYVVNVFSTADCSCKSKYFWKNSYRSLQSTSLSSF